MLKALGKLGSSISSTMSAISKNSVFKGLKAGVSALFWPAVAVMGLVAQGMKTAVDWVKAYTSTFFKNVMGQSMQYMSASLTTISDTIGSFVKGCFNFGIYGYKKTAEKIGEYVAEGTAELGLGHTGEGTGEDTEADKAAKSGTKAAEKLAKRQRDKADLHKKESIINPEPIRNWVAEGRALLGLKDKAEAPAPAERTDILQWLLSDDKDFVQSFEKLNAKNPQLAKNLDKMIEFFNDPEKYNAAEKVGLIEGRGNIRQLCNEVNNSLLPSAKPGQPIKSKPVAELLSGKNK